jgi:hypothetical protein
MKFDGGEAIAAGGFGCVFNPNIRCKNKTVKKSKNMVSKLMFNRDIETEINEIVNIKNIFNGKIKNYQKYFILDDIYSCKPDKLTPEDLINFDEKCENITEKNITKKNINSNLDKFGIINIPYGGISLKKKLKEILYDDNIYKEFANINNLLIELLLKAIVPMNKIGVNHFDLKPSNILFRDNSLKIIDFGLSKIHNHKYVNDVNSSILYNIPLSSILFDNTINQYISKFYKNFEITELNKHMINKILSIQLINLYYKLHSSGHNDNISNQLIKKFIPFFYDNNLKYSHNGKKNLGYTEFVPSIFFINIFSEYLTSILDKYIEYGIFNKELYFTEVYTKNADIWGFIMCYYDFIDNVDFENIWQNKLYNSILAIVFKYCYSPTYAAQPIPIDMLVDELKDLNIKLGFFDTYSDKTSNSKIKHTRKSKSLSKIKHTRKSKSKSTQKVIQLVGSRCPKGYKRHKLYNTLCVKVNK